MKTSLAKMISISLAFFCDGWGSGMAQCAISKLRAVLVQFYIDLRKENRQKSAPDDAGNLVTSTYGWDGLRHVKKFKSGVVFKTTTYVWDGSDSLSEYTS